MSAKPSSMEREDYPTDLTDEQWNIVPMFVLAGFTCFDPLEVKAGMNLIELKRNFGGKLAYGRYRRPSNGIRL